MTARWEDALEIVVAGTGHNRYRELCSDANPDPAQREAYRAQMIRAAFGEKPAPPTLTPADLALRDYVARHGCGGCGG